MKVRFIPSGITVEVDAGVTIFEAAKRAGLPVGNSCGAEGTCGRCGLRLIEGALPDPKSHELKVVHDNRVDKGLRLSCMVEIRSDIVVTADYW